MGLMDKPMAKLEERFGELRGLLQEMLEELRRIRESIQAQEGE